MRYGVQVPNLGSYGDPLVLASLAEDAERAGWDGFFTWDSMASAPHNLPVVDPWIALTAAAAGPRVCGLAR